MNEDPLTLDVVKWIRLNAIRIKTVEPNDDFSDLQELKEVLSGVDIIGLGEATHGTREFFQFKHRLLRFLSMELGFNTLAFETPFPGDINTSIRDRELDLLEAFREQTFVVWQTEEILETIAWMRDYNQKQSNKIEFIGIDCQLSKRMVKNSIDVLSKHGCSASAIKELRSLFDDFLDRANPNSKEEPSADFVLLGSSLLEQLSFLQATVTIAGLPDSISDHVIVLSQTVQLYMVQNEARKRRNMRDRFMAENVSRIASRGHKVAVWAHNTHVSCFKSNSHEDMGWHLRKSFGKRYYALAFTFFKGAFRSNFKSRTESSEYCVAMPPRENIEHLFHRAEIPTFFLDLRSSKKDRNIDRWWSLEHKAQGTGAIFKGGAGSLGTYAFSDQEYDGVVFIKQTNASVPL